MKSKENKDFKAKKPIFKRWWFWLIVVLVFAGAASGGGDDAATPASGDSSIISNVDTSQPEAPSAPAAAQEPADDESSTGQEPTADEFVDTQEPDSDNPLMSALATEIPVINGSKTERIGTAAYILSDKSLVTEAYLSEFASKRVEGSGYNWYMIKFPDETGIFFPGSMSMLASYGDIAKDGMLEDTIGHITIDTENGTCTYEPASE